ncbi:MAG: hypothetical protein COT33_01855 [Candidatus Nealsonbacteria bacterium CG08_land_8_20_14_0_20_38_20]|uniref:DUF11 domain-containing protein n=1 Tax=Candidatus Nealsonbacteria bacterium CG08_land_8_20_14_0_20_38_20 TaxID=1974705 RepID=A0A2H0YLY6_9BACT|nr:MAG: hypothetical protein COT33_01855 [Candidatus Nealsonbacteria bacterium CG08_land_8_20_14_0_20_38_20]
MRRLRIFVIILAVIIGLAGYWKYRENVYSKEVLKLEILGPTETTLLQEIEYAVKYKNNGNFNLEEAKLVFECPKNSLECSVAGKEKSPEEKKSLRKEFSLSTIYPGEEKIIRLKTRLLGKENETKEAKATISYRPKNLKALYDSSTTFTTQIKQVLLNFEFDFPSKAESGRELKFSLNYFSNLDYPLSNIGVKVEYPSGFQFLESKPQSLEKTDFEIKSLNKTEGGRIEINGLLTGNAGEQKIFRAVFGIWKEGEFIVLKEAMRGVEIIEPSLYISQLINGKPDYFAQIGDFLHYEIYFRNLGTKPFENLSLIAKLKGGLFDLSNIKSDSGENTSGDNTIVWDWKKVPELKFLDSGKEGKIEFWVNLKSDEQPGPGENPSVTDEIIFPGQTKKEFLTKINSKLILTQKGYIDDEIFGSPGPLPPRVGEKSYFTVVWQVENFYNKIGNAKVKAVLSPLAELTGKIFPENAALTFDSNSRELLWQIGDLEPGTEKKVQLAFQLALNLKEAERFSTLLMTPAEISGEDKWTNQILSTKTLPLYTNFSEMIIGEGIMPYSTSTGD